MSHKKDCLNLITETGCENVLEYMAICGNDNMKMCPNITIRNSKVRH